MSADAPTPVPPYAARPSRTPVYLIGGGILAVMVLIAGAVGWMAWEKRQDGEARAAYAEYVKLKDDVAGKLRLIALCEENANSGERLAKSAKGQGDDEYAEKMKQSVAADRERASLMKVEVPLILERLNDAEKQWGSRWRSLDLTY